MSEHINAMAYVRKGGSDAVASVGRVHGKEKINILNIKLIFCAQQVLNY